MSVLSLTVTAICHGVTSFPIIPAWCLSHETPTAHSFSLLDNVAHVGEKSRNSLQLPIFFPCFKFPFIKATMLQSWKSLSLLSAGPVAAASTGSLQKKKDGGGNPQRCCIMGNTPSTVRYWSKGRVGLHLTAEWSTVVFSRSLECFKVRGRPF